MLDNLERVSKRLWRDLYSRVFGRIGAVVSVALIVLCALIYFDPPYGGLFVLVLFFVAMLFTFPAIESSSNVVLDDECLSVIAQMEFIDTEALSAFRDSLSCSGYATLSDLDSLLFSERATRVRRERLGRPGAQALMNSQIVTG